jgi:hypothetical protein
MRVLLGFWLCLVGASVQQPRWQDPHLRAAEDYIRQKQLSKAAEILDIVVGVEPQCGPEVYLKLADLRQQLSQPDEVLDAEVHFLYGQWACMSSLNELCATELNKAVALSPSNDNALMQSYTLIAD